PSSHQQRLISSIFDYARIYRCRHVSAIAGAVSGVDAAAVASYVQPLLSELFLQQHHHRNPDRLLTVQSYIAQRASAVPIIAAQVALPVVAGTADMLSLLPPADAAIYSSASTLLRPPPLLPLLPEHRPRPPRARVHGSMREYGALL